MPVRKIPKNYRNVTGLVASRKNRSMNAFESPLERDFMLLLEFNWRVRDYEEQPVEIKYDDIAGVERKYTPDVLVHLRADLEMKDTRPWLCEVKSRDELRERWHEYKDRFRIAMRYCKEQGWRFRIVTDREIRTPFLDNAKFLLPFVGRKTPTEHQYQVVEGLNSLVDTTVEGLLMHIEPDEWRRAAVMPALWNLMAEGMVVADLEAPLTMKSRIHLRSL